ncbi:hypothetical protein [Loktanella fryxellensis]|uniref:hypothetical protein n=1 Tax=Loktanella fryxellensis TaxID=245187 RepID=UPI003CCC2149
MAGHAALAICESLLLAAKDRNILPEREVAGILQDAAAAHAKGTGDVDAADLHRAVAALIDRIRAAGSLVRRRSGGAAVPHPAAVMAAHAAADRAACRPGPVDSAHGPRPR